MTAFLCPVFGAGYQSFTNQGVVNGTGSLTIYLANSTTLTTTWTDSTQAVQNTNPIVLDTAGRPPQPIWLASGQAVKVVVKDGTGVQLGPEYNNLTGINDVDSGGGTTTTGSEWITSGLVPTYGSASVFTVPGNQTPLFEVGRRLQIAVGVGTVYGSVRSSSFGGSSTAVGVLLDSGALDTGISVVNYGLLGSTHHSLPSSPVLSGTYLPTLTAVSSVLSTTISNAQWSRTGNTVTVSGNFGVRGNGTSAFQVGLSVPVAANFDGTYQLAGTAVSVGGVFVAAAQADITNDRVDFQGTTSTSTTPQFNYVYCYTVP